MKVHRRDMSKNLFYLVLIVSFSLFVATCSSSGLAGTGLTNKLLGNFDALPASILLVGYPIAIALFYIGVSLRK